MSVTWGAVIEENNCSGGRKFCSPLPWSGSPTLLGDAGANSITYQKRLIANEKRICTAEQLQRMQKHADADLLTFMLLRWTGLRGSDAVKLRWYEIHFDRKEIERITQKRKKKVILPIHSALMALLEMEHDRRKPDAEERVLLNPRTQTPLSRPRLYERMLSLGKRAAVPHAHPHRFRDTFAVDMLARGASPYDVAKLLGDTIETVEKHYAEFVKELRERVRRMMESKEGGLEAFSARRDDTTGSTKHHTM